MWYFQERGGNVGGVKINIPTSSLPPYGDDEHLVLLLDEDGVFVTGAQLVTGTPVA